LAHQRLADKKGVEARRAQPVQVLGGFDAAFAHVHSARGQAGSQIERDLEPYRKRAEVAVIDSDSVTAQIQDPVKFLPGMHFAEHVQFQRVGLRGQSTEFHILQGGGDQQDGIRPMGARLQKLELIEQKIFAQTGQIARLRSHFQIAQTALEEVLFGEHREGSCASCGEPRSQGSHIEVRANHAPRRRCFFQLGDHCGPAGRLLPQRPGKAPRLVGGGCLLQKASGRCGLALLNYAPRAGQDLGKLAIHGLVSVYAAEWTGLSQPLVPNPPPPASKQLYMNHFPPLWANSAEAAVLGQPLRSTPRSLLMLDYDGTLAPFHVDRFAAAAYPGVEDRLATLSGLARVRLVLISGRPARELRGLLPANTRVEIWGSHGWEQLKSDGSYRLFPLDPVQRAALEQVAREMTALGFSEALEVKPASLAIHWRSVAPATQERIRSSIESVFNRITQPGGLHLLPFDGGLELRSTDRTKGTAVRQILAQEPAAVPVAYLGDDLTDEDAFAALGDRGFSILVRAEVRASCARFWLRPPKELLGFLDEWIAASQNPAPEADTPVEASR
jgi:trehalose 6-phosphate phosphatase